MNHDTFVDAVNHPERHPELLVRVSGYTAYFVDLNPRMQKEIIDRSEYEITGEKPWRMKEFDPFPLPGGGNGADVSWGKRIKRIPGVGFMADSLLELLLRGMDATFWFSRGYRRNIKGYKARLLFATKDGEVAVSAEFDDGNMIVEEDPDPTDDHDVRVIFKDVQADDR